MKEYGERGSCIYARHPRGSYPISEQLIIEMKIQDITAIWDVR